MIKKKLLILSGILLIFIVGGVLIFTNHLKISGNALKIDAKKIESYNSNKSLGERQFFEDQINRLNSLDPSPVLKNIEDPCADYCFLGGEQDNNKYCVPSCIQTKLDDLYQQNKIKLEDYEKHVKWINKILSN